MTLYEITSAIRNNIASGLKDLPEHAYPIEQIMDEIGTTRNLIILQASQQGILQHKYFEQELFGGVPLELTYLPDELTNDDGSKVLSVTIPKLVMTIDDSSIRYIGPLDMSRSIKLYFDITAGNNHKYSRVIKNSPYGIVDLVHDDAGLIKIRFYNLGESAAMTKLAVRAIFADPVKILLKDNLLGTREFPSPLAIQQQIIDVISEKYIKYYKQLNLGNQPVIGTNIK